jgi:hypothetical protein
MATRFPKDTGGAIIMYLTGFTKGTYDVTVEYKVEMRVSNDILKFGKSLTWTLVSFGDVKREVATFSLNRKQMKFLGGHVIKSADGFYCGGSGVKKVVVRVTVKHTWVDTWVVVAAPNISFRGPSRDSFLEVTSYLSVDKVKKVKK